MKNTLNFEAIASYYKSQYLGKIKLSNELLFSRMSLLGMISELRSYQLKKGSSDKIEERIDQYQKIFSVLEHCDSLESEKHTLSLLADQTLAENKRLKNKIQELEESIEAIRRFYEAK